MSQVIKAPSKQLPYFITAFLAGGITNCKEWQAEVEACLVNVPVSIYNPRQEQFDVTDKEASYRQILWEFERLESMEIFTMYFCNDESDQPICMYELGRNIVRMQNRFPDDWQDRIVVSVESGYKRMDDVLIQLRLCAKSIDVDCNGTPQAHANRIKQTVELLIN